MRQNDWAKDRYLLGNAINMVDPFTPDERWLTDSELIAEEFMKYANGEPYTPPPTLRITKIDYENGVVTFDSI